MCRVPVHDASVLRGAGRIPGKVPLPTGQGRMASGAAPRAAPRPAPCAQRATSAAASPAREAPAASPESGGRGAAGAWTGRSPRADSGPGRRRPFRGLRSCFPGARVPEARSRRARRVGAQSPRRRARNKSPPGAAASGGATAPRLRVPIRSRSGSPRGKRPPRSPVPPVPGARRRLEAPQSDSRPGRRPTPAPATGRRQRTGN